MGLSDDGEAASLRQRVRELEDALAVLRESESRLRGVLCALPMTVALVDPDGRVVYGNRGPYGVPLDECLGKSLASLLSKDQSADLLPLIERAARLQQSVFQVVLEPRETGDRTRAFEHGIVPVVGQDGMNGLVVMSRDVTESQRIERYAAHAQRMDAIGRLAGRFAQEFSELVLSLSTQTKLAMEGLAEGDPRRHQMMGVLEANHAAAELVRRLRAVSSSRLARVEHLDLNQVVERFVSLVRRGMPDDVELDFLPGHELGTVTADPALIEQILLNVCINSRDAMPRGGRIRVQTENALIDGKYQETRPWAKPGPYVLLRVSDDGLGMPSEVCERAFEPFFTTKMPGRGAGLGLATVYGAVQLHHGMIHLESEVGKGTTLEIHLPAVSRRPESATAEIEGVVRGGSEAVLVAEDQEDVLRLVTRLLSRAGYRVLGARDGIEAVQLFSDHVGEIGLVLMDVMMPRLGGREAGERIRMLDPDARILFTSGKAEQVLTVAGGFFPLLRKPYEPERLLRMVRCALDA